MQLYADSKLATLNVRNSDLRLSPSWRVTRRSILPRGYADMPDIIP